MLWLYSRSIFCCA